MDNKLYTTKTEEQSITLDSALSAYSNERNTFEIQQLLTHSSLNSNLSAETSVLLLQMMKQKNPDLKAKLGRCFKNGIGVKKNDQIAQSLYLEAIENNSKSAVVNISWSYYENQEYLKAIELLEDFIKNKKEVDNDELLTEAYSILGDSYSRTEIPDFDKSIKTLTHCGEYYHDGYSYYRLSSLYQKKEEDHYNIEKSLHCLKKAAEYGYADAILSLADSYLFGDEQFGIEKSFDLAKKTVQPLINSNDFNIIRKIIIIYYLAANYGNDSDNDHKTLVSLFDRLVDVYGEDNPEYSKYWSDIYDYAGKSCYALSLYNKALIIWEKAYNSGSSLYSDMYAYLLKEFGGKSPSEYLPIMKEHYDKHKCFSHFISLMTYLDIAYETQKYEDCLTVAVEQHEKDPDFLYYKYISRIVLFGHIKNSPQAPASDVVAKTEVLYEQLAKEEQPGDFEKEYKIIFANALGYYYNSIGSLWKAVNWYMKSDTLNDAEAAFSLGQIYERSVGTFKADSNIAYQWYTRAANLGSEKGKKEAAEFKKVFLRGMVRSR